jgi:predicted dehydrogenase
MSLLVDLIGTGRMDKVFAHALAFTVPEVELAAVADIDPQTCQEVAARFGAKLKYADHHALPKREDLDTIVIVTPTSTHAEIIKAAAGKHIVSEKPLAQTLAMCDEAIAVVAAACVKLQLGFMRCFDPVYVMAKNQIDDGLIGTSVMSRSTSRDPRRTSLDFARRENNGGLIVEMGKYIERIGVLNQHPG